MDVFAREPRLGDEYPSLLDNRVSRMQEGGSEMYNDIRTSVRNDHGDKK